MGPDGGQAPRQRRRKSATAKPHQTGYRHRAPARPAPPFRIPSPEKPLRSPHRGRGQHEHHPSDNQGGALARAALPDPDKTAPRKHRQDRACWDRPTPRIHCPATPLPIVARWCNHPGPTRAGMRPIRPVGYGVRPGYPAQAPGTAMSSQAAGWSVP